MKCTVINGGYKLEPQSGRTWGAWYFCPKPYLIQNIKFPPIYFWFNLGHGHACMHVLQDLDLLDSDAFVSINLLMTV